MDPYLSLFAGAAVALGRLFVAVPSATSADYYVATNGNDANDGSSAKPWRTIQKAASTVTAGAAVHVRSGTYNEIIAVANSGTAGAPITFQPDAGAKVVIDGTGFTDGSVVHSGAGLFNLRHKSYINILGFNFVHSYGAGVVLDGGCHHIKIGNNTFDSDFGWNPILAWEWASDPNQRDLHDLEIHGNYIHRSFLPTPYKWKYFQPTQPWAEMISLRGGRNISIHHNVIDYNQLGEGIALGYGTHDVQIYGNMISNTTSCAIYVDGSYAGGTDSSRVVRNIDIHHNRVHCPDAWAMALANEAVHDGAAGTDTVNIYNNVVYGSRQALAIGCWGPYWTGGKSAYIKNVTVINNTFYDCNLQGGPSVAINKAFNWDKKHPNITVSNVVFRNNLIFKGSVEVGTHGGNPLVAADHNGLDPSATVFGAGPVVGNPQFADAAKGDFHLSAGSPFIDKGSATGAPAADFDGVKRPQGAGFDIGAYEFTKEPVAKGLRIFSTGP